MKRRILSILAIVALLVVIGFVYYRYYFVFGDGTKAGTMNYFVHKGYMLKPMKAGLFKPGYVHQHKVIFNRTSLCFR